MPPKLPAQWKQPPLVKAFEAMGALADGRILVTSVARAASTDASGTWSEQLSATSTASPEERLEIAAKAHEPHRIAFYLYELASDFHALWNKGNENESLRFLQDDAEASAAKIALPRAVAVVISAGLGILGVTPAEEMR